MKALAPTPSLRPCTFAAPTLTGMSASPGPPAPTPISAAVPETNGSSAEIPWWWSRLTPSDAADGYDECVVRSAGPRDKGTAPVGGKAPWIPAWRPYNTLEAWHLRMHRRRPPGPAPCWPEENPSAPRAQNGLGAAPSSRAATPSARRARRSGGRRRRSLPPRTGTGRCGAAGGWRRSGRRSMPWAGPGTGLPLPPA